VAASTRWAPVDLGVAGVAPQRRPPRRFVPDQRVPDRVAVASVGVLPERLPAYSRSGETVGTLTEAAADALGLTVGLPVVGGIVDAFASYLGAGLLEPGDAYDPGGSAGGFGVYWDRPVDVPGGYVTSAPLAGRFSVGAAMATTGRALDWYRDNILGDTVTTATLLTEAEATPPGAEGLVFLPYLAGERSPIWDPEARGVLAGLSLGHGRGHVARAIIEAAALAIRHVAAPMLAAGVQVPGCVSAAAPPRRGRNVEADHRFTAGCRRSWNGRAGRHPLGASARTGSSAALGR
jgi:sugar (pentulose or hexulose) kinase